MTARADSPDSRELGLAWNRPNLAGNESLRLSSPDFAPGSPMPIVHAAERAGGENVSPALVWSEVPAGTAQLLLVIEDPDAPTPQPFVHCVALLDPSVTGLPAGALDARHPAAGVRVLRSGIGSGYFGPAPPKSHGAHRYVFQLFALAEPVTLGSRGPALESAKPRDVLSAATNVLACARHNGLFTRS